MEKISKDKNKIMLNVLTLIEQIVSKDKLDAISHKDEVEKYFFNLLNGKDIINVYVRRDAGINDEKWKDAIKELYIFLGIQNEKYEQEIINKFI